MERLKRLTINVEKNLETKISGLSTELMNASISFHKLHLMVTGEGSFSAHKALNELYNALPDFADKLVEGFQGATEKIIACEVKTPKHLLTVKEGVAYIRELYKMVSEAQVGNPYSEIVNDLDAIKSVLNSAKYKLLFLK